MFSAALVDLASAVIRRCQTQQRPLTVAESCTGGLIAGCLTEVPGASTVLERAFVTYGNRAKHEMLGVPKEVLERCGAVSEEAVIAMAEGALERARAGVAVAVSGIAGPGGGSADRPVGLVHLAALRKGGPVRHRRQVFSGDRTAIRLASVEAALVLLREVLDDTGAGSAS
ncbi:MAG: CinA family protein [Rhodospirillales bacterium]